MASNINYSNIDGTFPIAGQDNDSQGFRDNFTNIKNNLRYAKSEIEDLQGKAVLKSALTGGTLANDFNYAPIYRAQLKAPVNSFRDQGTQNGIATVSFLDAPFQKITTGGPLTISLQDFPPTGYHGSVRVWIQVQFASLQATADIIFPASVTKGINRLTGYNNDTKTLTVSSAGDYMFEFSTVDGGNDFWVIQLA